MATTGALKSLARLGYVRSIADQYEEQAADISDTLKGLLGVLRRQSDHAMQCWDEKLTQNDLRRIGFMLQALGRNTPLGNEHDITTYTAFGLCLLEDMPMLKAYKKSAVDQLKRSLLAVHNHFSMAGEEYQCLKSGADGADAWERAQIYREKP